MRVGLILGIVGFVVLLAIGLYIFMRMSKKKSFRYPFLLSTRDCKHYTLLFARIITDDKNNKIKKFMFADEKTIDISQPTTTYNGKPCRQITYNDSGEYVYISDSYVSSKGIATVDKEGNPIIISGSVDKSYHLQEISPQERELIARQIEDNHREYNVLDRAELFQMVGKIIFGVLIMIGIVYMVIQFAKTTDTIAELQVVNGVNLETMNSIMKYQSQVMEYLLLIDQQNLNGSILRTLE